ncbi:rRNA maturation RNase YbeY [Christiangramia sabulilitoris]|uniref:Endoribonuclease YbeY n=1 Tax=Christiangramia sabulilitoris TaxID=2583991 RepID=A0A550I8S8_9FLAO|nr:rRNA maturation RNase YbeY [Christiangramia sabulilitoris]TRO67377.1 rRNA maturation RNase YbeY [Christiangramia sabulilitoris]
MEKGEINFFSENNFVLEEENDFRNWVEQVIESENKFIGDINFIFCDDDYLHDINLKYLNHDTYTDIISFDNSLGNTLHGDIYISTERVEENASNYNVNFIEELKRVIIHGVLHFCGYKDKTEREKETMRHMEEEKIKLFHVEQ